jgi:hypothetical protein
MPSIRCCWLLAALLAAGCTTTPQAYPDGIEQRLAAYARAEPCCDDPGQFEFVPLPTAGTLAATVSGQSPAFEFQSGLSHFAAFRLPDGETPYRVRIKSLFDDRPAPGGSIFYPVVAMLDESFIVTRISNLDNLRLEPSLAKPGGETGIALVAPFDPGQTRERYIVVFTPGILLGAPPPERREGDTLTGPALDWLRRTERQMAEPSPFGRLEILVAPGAG